VCASLLLSAFRVISKPNATSVFYSTIGSLLIQALHFLLNPGQPSSSYPCSFRGASIYSLFCANYQPRTRQVPFLPHETVPFLSTWFSDTDSCNFLSNNANLRRLRRDDTTVSSRQYDTTVSSRFVIYLQYQFLPIHAPLLGYFLKSVLFEFQGLLPTI